MRFFFNFCLLFLWTQCSKITRRSEQKYYKSLSVTLHTETLKIFRKITSIYSHWWVYDCCVEAWRRAALRVVDSLSAWKCAVCVRGSLLVCFCQRWRVTSASSWSSSGFNSPNSEGGKNKSSALPDLNSYRNLFFKWNNNNKEIQPSLNRLWLLAEEPTFLAPTHRQTNRQTDEASEVSRNRC